MIDVELPRDHSAERRYVIEEFFSVFAEAEYRIVETGGRQVAFSGPKGRIRFADSFAASCPEGDLRSWRPPREASLLDPRPWGSVLLPAPFAEGSGPAFVDTGADGFYSPFDLFGSYFFMLSRWEEAVGPDRDRHGRFPGSASLAGRAGFLHRPILNEWAKTLVAFIREVLGVPVSYRPVYRLVSTHDCDRIGGYALRNALSTLVRRPKDGVRKCVSLVAGQMPYDTFEWLMGVDEAHGLTGRYYVMAGRSDPRFDGPVYAHGRGFQRRLAEIRGRGHEIGLHPSYNTCGDAARWSSEKAELERLFGDPIAKSRQHVLRYDPMLSIGVWEDCGLELDSTLGYADLPGYRCGTGDEFRLWNLTCGRPSKVREAPLVLMEGTLAQYLGLGPEEAVERAIPFISGAKSAGTSLTILFHNHSFDAVDWPGWDRAYVSILDEGA